ncbi:MAG: hypothetical protein J6U84_07355 [Bacteroidales bacterium]|nr:hypothetical protein [Bacteroidales bacterium]
MRIRVTSIAILLLASILCISCSTSSRGAKMPTTRKKKCKCPTFAYQQPQQQNTYYITA